MALKEIESFRGAKNKHPMTRCVCDCGRERMVRTTRFRLGLVTHCAVCARAQGAIKGGLKRRLPVDVAMTRDVMGVYFGNARRRGLEFSLTEDEVGFIIRDNCWYCGTPADPTNGIDRQDNAQGYTTKNVVPCCSTCNYAKRDMSSDSFLTWAMRIHEHQSLL